MVSMLTKLKYVGVSRVDLVDIYILYIRSVLEYCAVVWHSSLAVELARSLGRVQKTCLRVILGEDYDHYEDAFKICNLKTLFERREERCLSFVKKCLRHHTLSKMIPLNKNNIGNKFKSREKYVVKFARTNTYMISAVPYPPRGN
jgi:hypothetical protein